MQFHTTDNSTDMFLAKAVPSQEISIILLVKANSNQSRTIIFSDGTVYIYQDYISV